MSFDLYFVERRNGETWADLMDRREASLDPDEMLNDDDANTWAKIVAAVSDVVDGTETHANESCYELDHHATGMQLSYFPGEIALTIPYWYDGDDAVAVEQQLREVAAAIEQTTGLTAYDPQADDAFLSTGTGSAAATFDHVAARLTEHGVRPPPPAPRSSTKQPWWRRLLGGD